MRRNGEYLLQLINDILDLSKIEAGKMVMEPRAVPPPRHGCQRGQHDAALRRQHRNALVVRFTGPLPQTIHTDGNRLRQVIVNLVGNAVKFTENGSIRIDVPFLPQWQSGQSAVSVEVTDTGIGIPQEGSAAPVPTVHASRDLDHPEVRGHWPGPESPARLSRSWASGRCIACPERGARSPSRFPRRHHRG